MDTAKLASALGVPQEAAGRVGARVALTAFSHKLADFGVHCRDEAELLNLWEHATALDQITQQQQTQKQASFVDNALGMIRRAASGGSAGVTEDQGNFDLEVHRKVAEFMDDPSIVAAALVDLSNNALVNGGAR